MTIFHILDAVAQDVKIESETAVRPVTDDYATDDDEYETKIRRAWKPQSSLKQLRMIIYLFGMTVDGNIQLVFFPICRSFYLAL